MTTCNLPWWYGGDRAKSSERWQFVNPQGEIVAGGPWARSGRSLGIENDQICVLSDFGKNCDVIFRNPEGTRENNDEYIVLVLETGLEYLFSAYEERPPALKGKLIRDEWDEFDLLNK